MISQINFGQVCKNVKQILHRSTQLHYIHRLLYTDLRKHLSKNTLLMKSIMVDFLTTLRFVSWEGFNKQSTRQIMLRQINQCSNYVQMFYKTHNQNRLNDTQSAMVN